MTPLQRATFVRALDICGETLTHGCCVGADAEAHAAGLLFKMDVRKRPSNLKSQRAPCEGGRYVAEPEAPLKRNRKIVQNSDILMAAPKGYDEEQRSGTWATIRYARRSGVPVLIIWPDGSWKLEK